MGEQKLLKINRGISVWDVMFRSMLGILLFSFLSFIVSLYVTNLLPSLNESAFLALKNHAEGNVSLLSSELAYVSRSARQLADKTEAELRHAQADATRLRGDEALVDLMLRGAMDQAIEFLDNTTATGVFILYDVENAADGTLAGVYLRDPAPGRHTQDQKYTMLRGPEALAKAAGYELHPGWAHGQERLAEDDFLFFTEPMRAVRDYPDLHPHSWGYWSTPFNLIKGDTRIVTFTTPILDASGAPVGVFGVELSAQYIISLLPNSGVPFSKGFHLVTKIDTDGAINAAAAITDTESGKQFLRGFSNRIPYSLVYSALYVPVYEAKGAEDIYYSIMPLNLYDLSSPFGDGQYYLAAAAPKGALLKNSERIAQGIVVSLVVTLAAALLGALWISRFFSMRIERLAYDVRQADPEQPMELVKTNIREIDELAGVLKQMSRDIQTYAARMGNIVDMVGIPMGAFELQEESGRVFFSKSLFRLLNLEYADGDSQYMDRQTFCQLFNDIPLPEAEGEGREIEFNWNERQWLRMNLVRKNARVYGAMLDITEEIQRRRWLEYERDYDPLTKLLNRNSYPQRMSALIDKAPDEMGVLLFGDLDNLKHINDTYGHDMGDRYIQTAANALLLFEKHNAAVARISGDEFAIYLHGGPSREQLRAIVDETLLEVRARSMEFPDGRSQNVLISVGLAVYPSDATSIDELVRYADFAMYEIKHTVKGGTREFDRESYKKNAYVLRQPSQLDRLIEQQRLAFAYQPIIDVKTGRVFGYETLMRPQMREIHTPREIIALAKGQSRLYQIEKLTLSRTFEWLKDNQTTLGDKKIFINVISTQALSEKDFSEILNHIPGIHDSVVMEMTQSEHDYSGFLLGKASALRARGFGVALGNYGAGRGGEPDLLKLPPNYIKIDLSVINGVSTDEGNQKIVRRAVEHAARSGALVVAEGVETHEDLKKVIELGVPLVQGYYLGRPEYELSQHNASACREAMLLHAEFFGIGEE